MRRDAQTARYIRHRVTALDNLVDCFFLEFRCKPLGAHSTPSYAQRIGGVCLPDQGQSNHLAALVRFALATGCRASEIKELEWSRISADGRTAWLNKTKNGTPRGVPLNDDALQVLQEQRGKHPRFCFTYEGKPILWQLSNTAWQTALAKAEITDFRFHDCDTPGLHGTGRREHPVTS